MRKSKINLLVNREDYRRYEKYFYWTRIIAAAAVVLFILSASFLFFISFRDNSQINNILATKQSLLISSQGHESTEAKLIYVENKYQDLKDFMKNDAYSLPYYNLLSTAIETSTETASLKSFVIGKNRDVTFAVSFSNFNELMNFFRFVESEKFLKNFENITLKSFTAVGGDENKKSSYDLNFTGKFIPIDENKN